MMLITSCIRSARDSRSLGGINATRLATLDLFTAPPPPFQLLGSISQALQGQPCSTRQGRLHAQPLGMLAQRPQTVEKVGLLIPIGFATYCRNSLVRPECRHDRRKLARHMHTVLFLKR